MPKEHSSRPDKHVMGYIVFVVVLCRSQFFFVVVAVVV
jgi:hypothetical protein